MPIEVTLVLASLLAAVVVAVRLGGTPERLAAAIIAAWILSDWVYHQLFGPSGFDNVDPVHLVLDSVELLAISALALRANRMWPLWAAAAQLICVSGHFVALMEPGGMRRAYWAMTQIPQYIQILALTLGAMAHARRERRVGRYRSWRVETSSTA
jgi:hypothetical protein